MVVKRLNKNAYKIRFGIPGCDMSELKMLAFSDASLSNLPDKTSSTRSFVIFCGETEKLPLCRGLAKS